MGLGQTPANGPGGGPPTSKGTQEWRRAALGWVLPVVVGVLAVSLWQNLPWAHEAPRLNLGQPPWGLPEDAAAHIRATRLPPFQQKGDRQAHPHVHLDIFVDGQKVPIPAGLGLTRPWSAIHTHSSSGIIHIETSEAGTTLRLGQFFSVWGVRLDSHCLGIFCSPSLNIRAYVDGKIWTGSLPDLPLHSYQEIALVVGAPPKAIPERYDCHDAADMELVSCDGFLR